MDKAARDRALERLEVFIGEWTVEASIAPPEVVGRAVFEWMLDRQFLVERTIVPGAPDSTAIISLNGDGEAFTQHYFDSRGVVRLYAMTFEGGVWTLWRESPDFSPLDFRQRFIGKFSPDHRVINGTWEIDHSGSNWERDFDMTYTRAQ